MKRFFRWSGWLVVLGLCTQAWAALQPQEFDELYYTYAVNPQPHRLTEALDYYIHVTGTAGGSQDKDYRLYVASRARFFAVLAATNPAVLHHAESLFPQSYWAQKRILLEIFKRSKDPGVTAGLNHWAQLEEDDDRRLMLEQAALAGNAAPEVILEKPAVNPGILEEQWAVFFATGNTAVVQASLRSFQADASAATNSINAQGEFINQGSTVFKERIWEKLEQYSSVYPAVRLTLQTEIGRQIFSEENQKKIVGMLAWQNLEAGDAAHSQALMPFLENDWKLNSEKLNYYRGALAVLNDRPDETRDWVGKLSAAEPMWAERLLAWEAYWKYKKIRATLTESEPQPGGEKYARQCAQYLKTLKSFLTYESLTMIPQMIAGDEKIMVRQQVKRVSLPDDYKGWQREGVNQSAWKIEQDKFFLWTERNQQWTEIRNQRVREKIVNAYTLNRWYDFLSRQIPKTYRELKNSGEEWVALHYETDALESFSLWDDAYGPVFPSTGVFKTEITIELNKGNGQLQRIEIFVPNIVSGRSIQIEKIYFNQ